MIDKAEILQHGESRDFGSHPCEEAPGLFRIVAYCHELVAKLEKDGFNSLSEPLVCPRWRSPVLLVQPIEQIILAIDTESLGSDDKATTSRSEKVGTAPLRGTFPFSFT